MNSTQVAVDLAKSVFEVALSRRPGKVHESHRLSCSRFQKFFAVRELVEVLMEAYGTAHPWQMMWCRPICAMCSKRCSVRSTH